MDNDKNDAEPIPLIQVVEVDEPSRKLKTGFFVTDVRPGSPEEAELDEKLKPEVYLATDEADRYFGSHGDALQPVGASCYPVIPVLEFLWGKPWNNMALNFIQALRPSMLRVTQGEVTCDSRTWRVTVYLESDNRTIKRIEQEVVAGALGIRFGSDLHCYMEGREPPAHYPSVIINTRALRALEKLSEEK